MNAPRPIDSDCARPITRRCALKSGIAVGGLWLEHYRQLSAAEAASKPSPPTLRYKIGVCDWMMLKRQKLVAFPLAKDVGADGVEVDMGSLGQRETFQNALADAPVRKQFQDA